MSSTGNVFPGTGANDASIGATAWTNPGNITATDASDATCNAGASSQYLVAKNFGFSIPAGAGINGITVRVNASETSAGAETLNARLQDAAGALTGTGKTASVNGTSKIVYTYGSTADVWGATLDSTIINDVDFGVRLWYTTAHNVAIDYVTLAVEYTVGSVALTTQLVTATAGVMPSGASRTPLGIAATATGGTFPSQSGAPTLLGTLLTATGGLLGYTSARQIQSGQGLLTPTTPLTGIAITAGRGDVTADTGPPVGEVIDGLSATAVAQDIPGTTLFVRLHSKKPVGGSATRPLVGSDTLVSAAGLFTPVPSRVPTSQVAALLGGTFGQNRFQPLTSASITSTGGSFVLASDWNTRATSLGVVLAKRMENAADYPILGSPGGNTSYILNDITSGSVSRDTTTAPPGALASAKFTVLSTDVASAGSIAMYFGGSRTFGAGDTVWFSYQIKAPASMSYQQWFASASALGHKLSILSCSTGSNQVNEVVVQSTNNRGTIQAYHQDGSAFPPFLVGAITNCSSSDFKEQSSINRGINPLIGNDPETGSIWSPCAQDRARYGSLYSAQSLSQFQYGYGDPLDGGFRQYPDEWLTITGRLFINSLGGSGNRFTLWAARFQSAYTMVLNDSNFTLGAGPRYDTLWLLPYATSRAASTGTHLVSRTSNITGTSILVTGFSTAVGAGTLEYTASTGMFRWKGAGEVFGTSRAISAANGITTINVASTTLNSYVTVKVTPASLPSSGVTTDTVTIAAARPDTQVNYGDVIISTNPINAPGGYPPSGISTLGDLATAMPVGTWLEITSTNLGSIVTGQGGAAGSMLNDCSYFPWNPISKKIELVGMDHYGIPNTNGTQRHYWYDDTAGTFVRGTDDDLVVALSTTPAHGFGHTQVNPYTGDVYHHKNDGGSILNLWKSPFGSVNFTQLPSVASAYAQVVLGSCWWTGPFTGRTLGAQGAYMLFNSGASQGIGTGEIAIYDPTVPGWLATLTNVTPSSYVSDYNSVMAYSAVKNVAIYGGGHGANAFLCFRLNSDGTHTNMPTVPAGGMGLQQGCIAADPVTGNFLLFSNAQLWELDPTGSGTWTQQTGSRAPPARMYNYTQVVTAGAPCSIPDYGVVANVLCPDGTSANARFFLYKHANPATGPTSYSTSFALTENPISEGGVWVNGGTTGINWQNIRTNGTSEFGVAVSAGYDDCIAVLSSSIGVNATSHYAQATCKRVAGYSPPSSHECELLTGFTITANVARGYEVTWGIGALPQVVRWNGAINDFTVNGNSNDNVGGGKGWVNTPSGSGGTALVQGDVVKVQYSVVGGNVVLTVYQNGTQVLTVQDTSVNRIVSGQPGMGNFARSGATMSSYCWSNFSAG